MTSRTKRNQKNRKNRRKSTQARLGMERLEARQLMAGSLDIGLDAGTLMIQGSDSVGGWWSNSDYVRLSDMTIFGSEYVRVTAYENSNGTDQALARVFPKSQVDEVVFEGSGGHDRLWNDVTGPEVSFNGGSGTDRIIQDVGPISLLSDTSLIHGAGRTVENVNLSSIERATLTGTNSNDLMNASAFTGRATLKGGSGDDTLIGGSGGDYLYGEGGNDSLKGSSGSDRLYGGDGHDNLYGQGGTDRLYGGNGVDGLYGGNGADYLTGGSGSDRFLHQDGDTINDHKRSQDARIDFENGGRDTSRERDLFAGAWTQDEIELVDQALGDLHMQTMDDTLLETSAGNRMHFRRHGRGNVLGLHNGAQRILFTNGAFSNDDLLRRTVFHEIGHNWEREHGDFSSWRALSGWTSGGRNNHALQDSLDGNWRHRRNANFVSDYAKNNPFDDFADTFAAIFADKRGDTFEADLGFSSPANVLDIADLNGKRNHINNWLDGLTR